MLLRYVPGTLTRIWLHCPEDRGTYWRPMCQRCAPNRCGDLYLCAQEAEHKSTLEYCSESCLLHHHPAGGELLAAGVERWNARCKREAEAAAERLEAERERAAKDAAAERLRAANTTAVCAIVRCEKTTADATAAWYAECEESGRLNRRR